MTIAEFVLREAAANPLGYYGVAVKHEFTERIHRNDLERIQRERGFRSEEEVLDDLVVQDNGIPLGQQPRVRLGDFLRKLRQRGRPLR